MTLTAASGEQPRDGGYSCAHGLPRLIVVVEGVEAVLAVRHIDDLAVWREGNESIDRLLDRRVFETDPGEHDWCLRVPDRSGDRIGEADTLQPLRGLLDPASNKPGSS